MFFASSSLMRHQ